MKQNGTLGQAPQPTFGLSATTFNFDALIDGTRSTPFVYELDLSTARSFAASTAVQIKITGNCLLIDSAPDVGNGYVIFEGVQDYTAGQVRAPIYAQPGFVTRLPFANVYVANAAQPGKKLRFIYGVDLDFQQMFPAQINARPAPIDYQQTFVDFGAKGAATATAIWTPAQNVNGAILWNFQSTHQNAVLAGNTLLAKSSTPTTLTDGDVLSFTNGGFATGNIMVQDFWQPTFITAGKGLYFFVNAADTGGTFRRATYTLL